jgi:hypothetical protein
MKPWFRSRFGGGFLSDVEVEQSTTDARFTKMMIIALLLQLIVIAVVTSNHAHGQTKNQTHTTGTKPSR